MTTSQPRLPLLDDGTLPPARLLLQALAEARSAGPAIDLPGIPHGNAAIPVLCQLAGIDQVRLADPALPSHWTWQVGEAAVAATNRCGNRTRTDPGLHQGPMPPRPAAEGIAAGPLWRLNEVARLADAAAALSGGQGADWGPALRALAGEAVPAPPPLATDQARFTGPMRAWNPLPFARRCVVALPTDGGTAPWSVVDSRGAKHPLQVVMGADGERWLTELALGPLECVGLRAWEEPVTSSHFEVGQRLLDNGRVRAEFDQRGRVVRLCFDGRFVALDAPLVDPLVGGRPLAGAARLEVLESGPTRARVAATIDGAEGTARITYTLHANDDALQVGAAWHGRPGRRLALRHRLSWSEGELRCCGETTPWSVDPRSNAFEPEPPPVHGLRWACRRDADRALLVLGQQPFALEPADLAIPVTPGVRYALADGNRASDQLSAGRAALSLAVPGRPAGTTPVLPARFRLVDADGLVPLWIERPAGWQGQLLLAEQEGSRGTARFAPTEGHEVALVDARGETIQTLGGEDGQGWALPYQPYGMYLVRWR